MTSHKDIKTAEQRWQDAFNAHPSPRKGNIGPFIEAERDDLRAYAEQVERERDAANKRVRALEIMVDAYGPKSLQYDIEHPCDGLNSGAPSPQPVGAVVEEYLRAGESHKKCAEQFAKRLTQTPYDEKEKRHFALGWFETGWFSLCNLISAALAAQPTKAVGAVVALPKPDVIAYTCIGDNDAYSEIALRAYGDARERSAIAAQTASPAKVGGSVREIPSADTPEFQQLAMYWRNEPCGSRAFENGWNELIAHIGTYAAALAAQTAAPQTVGGVDELSAFEQAAQACDQQADGTNGAYRTACLQCANAVRELRDAALAKQGEANG